METDDPENETTFLEKFKRDTPGETLLAMLAEPTLSFAVTQSRYKGSAVQIEVSGDDWHTYQFRDALRRYQIEQHHAGEAADIYRKRLLQHWEMGAQIEAARGSVPPFVRKLIEDQVRDGKRGE